MNWKIDKGDRFYIFTVRIEFLNSKKYLQFLIVDCVGINFMANYTYDFYSFIF